MPVGVNVTSRWGNPPSKTAFARCGDPPTTVPVWEPPTTLDISEGSATQRQSGDARSTPQAQRIAAVGAVETRTVSAADIARLRARAEEAGAAYGASGTLDDEDRYVEAKRELEAANIARLRMATRDER